MTNADHLKRAHTLFKQGHFEQYITYSIERFTQLEEGATVSFEGHTLAPYFDQETTMVVYGKTKQTKRGTVMLFLAFSRYHYFYDAAGTFEWYDTHTYGFGDGK